MVKWFKKKLYKWVNEAQHETDHKISGSLIAVRESDSVESDPVLNFKVYNAIGGKIVEFRHYDRQKDRNFNQTYIITADQDFGERIAKIATLEALKN
jgi:hypothetical protein